MKKSPFGLLLFLLLGLAACAPKKSGSPAVGGVPQPSPEDPSAARKAPEEDVSPADAMNDLIDRIEGTWQSNCEKSGAYYGVEKIELRLGEVRWTYRTYYDERCKERISIEGSKGSYQFGELAENALVDSVRKKPLKEPFPVIRAEFDVESIAPDGKRSDEKILALMALSPKGDLLIESAIYPKATPEKRMKAPKVLKYDAKKRGMRRLKGK